MENTQKQKIPETLTPEQMESGKWYVVVDNNNCKWLIKFKFINKYEKVFVDKYCYDLTDDVDRTDSNNSFCFKEDIKSTRPATKEEVLKYFPDEVFEPIELRLEEPTDWEAKYNELKSRYEVLVTEAHKLDVLSGEMCDKFTELKAKYEQLEPKGEKVYFFTDHSGNLRSSNDIQFVLERSGEDYRIFEANVIGKKKSVLVNK